MARLGYSLRLRLLTLLLLLWVGFDLGAHGLLASDFPPLGGTESCTRLTPAGNAEDGATLGGPDHCFCHSISVGAVPPEPAVALAPLGAIAVVRPCRVPQRDRTAIDHPPQLAA